MPESEPHSFADIERVIVDKFPDSEQSEIIAAADSGGSSARFQWAGFLGALLVIVLPVVGIVQYWNGSFGASFGGNVDVEFDSGRASVLVPICFGFLILFLLWFEYEWLRKGRPRMGTYLYPGVYFGISSALALGFANGRGISTSPGSSLEATVLWLCAVLSAAAVVCYVFLGRQTEESRVAKVREKLRLERRDVGNVLVSRGLMTDEELGMLRSKPFGAYIREGGRE